MKNSKMKIVNVFLIVCIILINIPTVLLMIHMSMKKKIIY